MRKDDSMRYAREIAFEVSILRPARGATRVAAACAALAILPLIGCASTPNVDDSTATTPSRSDQEALPPPAEDAPEAADAPPTSDAAESMNDAQIIGVVKVANESEVAIGQLAVQKAMTSEVRDYAHDMVQDHLVGGQHADQTATTEPPGGSEMATTMIQEANAQIETLNAMTGTAFDRAYVESQVEAHRELLDNIQSDLLPQAESVAVRQLLETMRGTVSDHLEHARELQQQLASIAG